MVLLQLAVPKLRAINKLREFKRLLLTENRDLSKALAVARLPAKSTALLDADGGSGWDLVAGLLRPRSVKVRHPICLLGLQVNLVDLFLEADHLFNYLLPATLTHCCGARCLCMALAQRGIIISAAGCTVDVSWAWYLRLE